MAENVGESLHRGARVIVSGRLEQRSWETEQGDKRSKVEVVADEIGPSLRWATAEVTKNERREPGQGGGSGGGRPVQNEPAPSGAGRRRWRLQRGRGALLMARKPIRGQEQGQRPPRQEEDQHPLPGAGRVRRLQGREPAAPVHVRPGQDPGPPGHRQRRAAAGHIAMAIKNAREMALLPYTNRVTQQRGGRDRGDRGDRQGLRADGPPPRPTAPPPTPGAADLEVDDEVETAAVGVGDAGGAEDEADASSCGPTSRRSGTRATSSTSPTATPATTSCPRAGR